MDTRQFGGNNPTERFARQMRRGTRPSAGDYLLGGLIVVAVYAALTVPFMLWSGFVLVRLWSWFAVPLGAPALTLAPAIGVNLLASFLVARGPGSKDNDWQRIVSFAIFYPAVALLFGYFVHLFVS